MKDVFKTFELIILAMLSIAALTFLLFGCGTTSHKKRLLEQMYPECEVSDELEITCPPPNEGLIF